jgi:hypothetical protein
VCEKLYQNAGLHDNVLVDDRIDVSLKLKLKEALLTGSNLSLLPDSRAVLGYPYVVIVGRDTVRTGIVELIERAVDAGGKPRTVPLSQLALLPGREAK